MNKYHSTQLKYDKEKKIYSFTVPEDLDVIRRLRNSKILYIYGVVKKNLIDDNRKIKEGVEAKSDDIQLYITPYEFERLKKIYWFEISYQNVPGSFLHSLDILNSIKLDILDCIGVDASEESTGKKMGKTEVIAEYTGYSLDNDFSETEKKIPNKQSFLNQSIIDSDNYMVLEVCKLTVIKEGDEEINQIEKQIVVDNNKFTVVIPDSSFNKNSSFNKDSLEWKEFKKLLFESQCLSITSFPEGNFITVKFKSKNERIITGEIKLNNDKTAHFNDTDLLYTTIKALWGFGVDMRYVTSLKNEDFTYRMLFNVADTGLEYFCQNNLRNKIEEIIKNEIKKIDNRVDFTVPDKEEASEDVFFGKIENDNESLKNTVEVINKYVDGDMTPIPLVNNSDYIIRLKEKEKKFTLLEKDTIEQDIQGYIDKNNTINPNPFTFEVNKKEKNVIFCTIKYKDKSLNDTVKLLKENENLKENLIDDITKSITKVTTKLGTEINVDIQVTNANGTIQNYIFHGVPTSTVVLGVSNGGSSKQLQITKPPLELLP